MTGSPNAKREARKAPAHDIADQSVMSESVDATDEVVPMTVDEAHAVTNSIRQLTAMAWVAIANAYHGRAWVALGYATWDDYCTAEFDGARIRIPREERQQVVESLRDAGLSIRAIAAATGVSKNTVHDDVSQIGTPAPITGTDGKTYRKPTPTEPRKRDRQREADEARAQNERQLNASIGQSLFILSALADVPANVTRFAANYASPGPTLTTDNLKDAARTLDQLINEWKTP